MSFKIVNDYGFPISIGKPFTKWLHIMNINYSFMSTTQKFDMLTIFQ